MTYLEQLRADREVITQMLEKQQSLQPREPVGVQMTGEIYIQILTDALSALNSLIQFLEKER